MRDARHAGPTLAAKATTIRQTVAATTVVGSAGATSSNRRDMTRALASEPTRPGTSPGITIMPLRVIREIPGSILRAGGGGPPCRRARRVASAPGPKTVGLDEEEAPATARLE